MPTRHKKLNYKALSEDFAQWCMFTVGMTLAPILVTFITTSFRSNQAPDFMAQASLKGELLIASVAIVAEACSDMFKRSTSKSMKSWVGGLAVILLVVACTVGTNVQENKLSGKNVNDFSFAFFGACLVVGAGTKVLARS